MNGRQLTLLPDGVEVAFIEFHHNNPHVYTELVAMAREWKAAGHTRASMKLFFEVLRWQRGLKDITSYDDFTLNNNFTSRYARLIEANNPDLAGLFAKRKLADERAA